MKNFEYVVKEAVGIHARPASQLVTTAKLYKSKITIDKTGKKADVKSIISIMALGVKCGERIVFSIEGDDEELATQGLEEFCGKNL